jgi:hypothetical protein
MWNSKGSADRTWHYRYYTKIVETIEKPQDVLDNFFLNGEKRTVDEVKNWLKKASDNSLAKWREQEEADLTDSEKLDRSQYVDKNQNRVIKNVFMKRLRAAFKEALKRGNWAAFLFLHKHHDHLSNIKLFPFQLRCALSLIMEEYIVRRFANNIQAFVTGGAAFLIVSIGLRAIGADFFKNTFLYTAIANNSLVIFSLGLEFSLLILYSVTIFYTDEDDGHAPSAAVSEINSQALEEISKSIKGVGEAVGCLSGTIGAQDQLKSLKHELERTVDAINQLEMQSAAINRRGSL